MTVRRWRSGSAKPGSLVSPVARHTAGFLIAVIGAMALSRANPGADEPVTWLLGGLLIGAACGLLGGGWVGLLFVVAGLWIGTWFAPDRPVEIDPDTLQRLGTVGPPFLAAVAGASVAYAVVLVGLRRVRPSGLTQRPSR